MLSFLFYLSLRCIGISHLFLREMTLYFVEDREHMRKDGRDVFEEKGEKGKRRERRFNDEIRVGDKRISCQVFVLS